MRISTSMMYQLGVAGMQRSQEQLLQTQQQMSSGRRVVTPADDPVAAAQALQITQTNAVNDQYKANRNVAGSQLSETDGALDQVTNLLQSIRDLAVSAGNGTASDSDRATIATQIQAYVAELLGVANQKDSAGQYLFSGYQGAKQPFTGTGGAVQFVGDDGTRQMQVGASRQLAVNLSGADVFERIRNGNGTFATQPAAANSGSGLIDAGSVTNTALLTGHNYRIDFTVAAGVTTYNVLDLTAGTTVLAAQPYSGAADIGFDGITVHVSGAPANGDRFTIVPSTNQSVFKTLNDLVTTLQTSTNNPGGKTQVANALGAALTNIDQGLNTVLTQRVAVGARLKEIDTLNDYGDALGLQYQSTLSNLQDLDYAKAISDLTQQQTILTAAQKTFAAISGLSLFDKI
jgi:flagellar hook-associated protein 3 FlgL